MKKMLGRSARRSNSASIRSLSEIVDLEGEYRLIRAALLNAGLDMTDSIDALYRDWQRWRDKPKSFGHLNSLGVSDVDQWWARHLEQFRRLIDPSHLLARAQRARKDQITVRSKSTSCVAVARFSAQPNEN
jgi:hypothetical protein